MEARVIDGVVVLLSGGLDSALCLGLALERVAVDRVVALSVMYGQPHGAVEGASARSIASRYGVELVETSVVYPGASSPGDPSMLWPGRNLVLCSLANALRESRDLSSIVIGANADDRAGYPDCRPEFFAALRTIMPIETPLINMTKPEIGARARDLDVPVDLTWTCYYPSDGLECGTCDACAGRARALP